MSRYIDADALKQSVRDYFKSEIAKMPTTQSEDGEVIADEQMAYKMLEFNKALNTEVIENAPSIDIVRRKAVKGYEEYYEVDMYGDVYSVDRVVRVNDNGREYDKPVKGRKLKQSTHSKGYRVVPLTKDGETKSCYVHRIVAEAYIENPQNLPFINHKDEDKTNNFVGNLEWCTEQYNSTYGNARKKQADALRGRPLSEEHKEKIRQGNIGKHGKSYGERKESE